MSLYPSAADLLRSIGLEVDGPTRWGARPTSRSAGIFVVESPSASARAPIDLDEVRRWLERVPELRLDGERPTQTTLAARLASFWLPAQTMLYVGRTSRSLSARVASLYATTLGHALPHPGGYWLKTLRDQPRLRLWWAETDAPEEYEDELIEAFGASLPADARRHLPDGAPPLPWANLESPTGPARDTGISQPLLSPDATPVKASGVKRSDDGGRKRRPAGPPGRRPARRSKASPSTPAAGGTTRPAAGAKDAPTHVTADGLAGMQAELQRLREIERPAVVERVRHARELGDLRENADYEAARNEQSFLEGRIQQLEQQLRTAVVIRSAAGGSVSMGSTVVCEVDGSVARMTIVGSTESDPAAGRISAASPVGRALIGHRAGDEVVVTTPAARTRYRILEVG